MNEVERHECNEEYWADRRASRSPMKLVGGTKLLDHISAGLGKRVISDAEEAGIDAADIAAMRERMNQWVIACRAFQRDTSEVRRDCKDPREMADVLATMRLNLDLLREEVFGE